MSTGPGDEEAARNCSTSGLRLSTAEKGDPPTTTDDTWSTNDGTAAGPTSRTDYTTQRITNDSDSDALFSPSTTVEDPAAALSTSPRPDALTTLKAPDTRLNRRTIPGKTTVVTKTEHNSEVTGSTNNPKWETWKITYTRCPSPHRSIAESDLPFVSNPSANTPPHYQQRLKQQERNCTDGTDPIGQSEYG